MGVDPVNGGEKNVDVPCTGALTDGTAERCAALAVRLLGEALGAWSGCAAACGANDEAPLLGACADDGSALDRPEMAGASEASGAAVPPEELADMWAHVFGELLPTVRRPAMQIRVGRDKAAQVSPLRDVGGRLACA